MAVVLTERKQKKKTRTTFKVNGVQFHTPHPPKFSTIYGSNTKKDNQVFGYDDLPDFMEKVTYSGQQIVWTSQQRKFIEEEYRRCKKDGYWFMCNGEVTYITPIHYFYLRYYTLENGEKPEYRDVDRRWFYFLDYCLGKGYIKGIVRLKKRREGATSQTCCWLLWRAIFYPNSNCGIVSKTEEDAEAAYKDMVLAAWNELPPYFKPEHDRYTSKRIVLSKKATKAKDGEDFVLSAGLSGMNSKITYRPTTLTAYDSGRVTALLLDESTKWDKVNVLEYLPKVLKTMMMGTKRVGFALLPSSMNQLDKGGDNFRTLYKNSDQTSSEEGRTQTGLYKYFVPAFDGFPGFIGKYGESIIEKPTKKQLEYLLSVTDEDNDLTGNDLRLGAKAYLAKRRAQITDPILLAECKRSEPFSEDEVLYDGDRECYFPATLLQAQLKAIDAERRYIRHGRLYEDESGDVHFADDPQGNWHFLKMPADGIRNAVSTTNGLRCPMFPAHHKIGVDPFRNTQLSLGSKGSNGCIVVMENFDPLAPDDSGMPVAYYRGRPRMKSLFYKEVEMVTRFFSCKALIERDVDDFYEYFLNKKLLAYCRNTPPVAIDPQYDAKKKASERNLKGVKSGNDFAMNKELEVAQLYINKYCGRIWFPEIIQDLYEYDHLNRTKSDLSVALMMALLDMSSFNAPAPVKKSFPLAFKTYNLMNAARR